MQSRFWTFLGVIPSVTLIIVLGFGALAAGQGRVTLGTLVAFTTLMMSLVWPVSALGFLLSMAQEAMTAADRIAEILDAENPIADGTRELTDVRGELALEHVSFRFPDADADVLHDLNLHLRPGETIALVGATGSGKSILTNLIARLWDVTGGRITLDGVDVRDLRLRQLRQLVATAFEDPTLFSMSARENLTLGRPDASDADVAQAIEVAQAQFVYDLPFGLDTRIGEQGLSLSGGQRQRLALARAVLARPAVLVLDDTLSALDIHTEALVEAALQRVLRGVTGIVVAHRASTVLLADRVALLSGGTITHVGTHAELLARVPEYRAAALGRVRRGRPVWRWRREPARPRPDRTQPRASSGAASSRGPGEESERLTGAPARQPPAAGRCFVPPRAAGRLVPSCCSRTPPASACRGSSPAGSTRAAADHRGRQRAHAAGDRRRHGRRGGAAVVGRISFLRISGRVGQDVLLSLRRRVFAHFQRLDVAFHDRYTSGRVTSRLTSDIDAITELLAGGFDGLVTAVLTMVGVGILMLSLDLELGAGLPAVLPAAGAARALVRAYVGRGLPQGARGVRPGHRAVRGDDDRHPRGPGVPPGAAQRRDLR